MQAVDRRRRDGPLTQVVDSLEKVTFTYFFKERLEWMWRISERSELHCVGAERERERKKKAGASTKRLFCVRYLQNSCVRRRAKLSGASACTDQEVQNVG